MKRIMVDMSVSLIHHGHIKILKSAKKYGHVVASLTTDDEIIKHKGYEPELNYESRFQILESIKYVDEVVPGPWLVDEEFLNRHHIDLLVHGTDNVNPISKNRLLVLPRTKGISSTILRARVLKVISDLYLKNN